MARGMKVSSLTATWDINIPSVWEWMQSKCMVFISSADFLAKNHTQLSVGEEMTCHFIYSFMKFYKKKKHKKVNLHNVCCGLPGIIIHVPDIKALISWGLGITKSASIFVWVASAKSCSLTISADWRSCIDPLEHCLNPIFMWIHCFSPAAAYLHSTDQNKTLLPPKCVRKKSHQPVQMMLQKFEHTEKIVQEHLSFALFWWYLVFMT